MRLPLATTLRNRTHTLTRDARLLNCVVDSKGRVTKRPSLVANFGPVTAGNGLGLFVRSTPDRPDDPGDEELIAITGSTVTVAPSAFFVGSHTVVRVNYGSENEQWGFSTGNGSITPTTFNGITITDIYYDSNTATFTFRLNSDVGQSFLTSISDGTNSVLGSEASYTGGGVAIWSWPSDNVWTTATGSISIAIS